MTGCKTEKHASKCIIYIWDLIKLNSEAFNFKNVDDKIFHFLIVPVMRNIDFSLNFTIDRLKIDAYINNETPYRSLLETSSGYTGVNASFPIRKDVRKTLISKYTLDEETNTFILSKVFYEKYFEYVDSKDRKKKEKNLNNKCITFLLFQSGKTISSGINAEIMREPYYEFLDVIRTGYHKIIEILD